MKKLLSVLGVACLATGLVLGQSEKKSDPWKLFKDDGAALGGRILENRLWKADDPRTANPLNLYQDRNPLNPANRYRPDNDYNPLNRYRPDNPLNRVNRHDPGNLLNRLNRYHPDSPLNPVNHYRSPADPPRQGAFEMRLPRSGTRPTYRFPTVRSLWEGEDP